MEAILAMVRRAAVRALLTCLCITLAGISCPMTSALAEPPAVARIVPNPAGAGARLPRLALIEGGGTVLSWVEAVPEGHALKFAQFRDGTWHRQGEAVRGSNWFVNWADFPSIVPVTRDFWMAHWLVVQPGGRTYDYDVAVAVSTDAGATWSRRITPHRDAAAAEHGFATIFRSGDRAALVWLDGRDYVNAKDRDNPIHKGKSGNFALLYTEVGRDGSLAPERILDHNVCTCCTTSAAVTSLGPVVAYRARRRGEIRDNHVVRADGGRWTEPVPLGAEGWHISGCPVNGPALAANGDRVAAAWFTAESNRPRVRAALSLDGGKTFGRSLAVDERNPLGRVAIAWRDPQTAVVMWLTAPDDATKQSNLVMRTLSAKGTLGPVEHLAIVSPARSVGMPQLAVEGDLLLVAWTEPAPSHGVRTAVVGPVALGGRRNR